MDTGFRRYDEEKTEAFKLRHNPGTEAMSSFNP